MLTAHTWMVTIDALAATGPSTASATPAIDVTLADVLESANDGSHRGTAVAW